MSLLLSYFSTRRMALLPPLFLAVFALVFLLYGLPLYAVGYACALCAPMYLAALAVSFARFARRHRTLNTLLTCADLCSAHLPAPRDALEADYQAASDHLNLVQTALRQQEKIERYEADLDELQIRLEEQNEVVAEAIERQEENEARAEAAELEVDELKSQLADYQQALDVQQTRAIQYNQAIAALNRAKELCHLPDLTADSAAEWLETFQAKELEATEKMLSLEQKMSMAQTAHSPVGQA